MKIIFKFLNKACGAFAHSLSLHESEIFNKLNSIAIVLILNLPQFKQITQFYVFLSLRYLNKKLNSATNCTSYPIIYTKVFSIHCLNKADGWDYHLEMMSSHIMEKVYASFIIELVILSCPVISKLSFQ